MSLKVEEKENEILKKPKSRSEACFSYHFNQSVSEDEIKRRIAAAYNILFTEVLKKINSVDKSN